MFVSVKTIANYAFNSRIINYRLYAFNATIYNYYVCVEFNNN